MPRLFRLAIAMLPLALGAAAVGAQEPPHARPAAGQHGGQGPAEPREARSREVGSRESLLQRRREPQPTQYRQAAPEPARQDNHSMSDAVRRVQRSTGGQILGAEQVPFEGRNITRVKYMDDRGRVRYMDDPGAADRKPPRRADNGGQ